VDPLLVASRHPMKTKKWNKLSNDKLNQIALHTLRQTALDLTNNDERIQGQIGENVTGEQFAKERIKFDDRQQTLGVIVTETRIQRNIVLNVFPGENVANLTKQNKVNEDSDECDRCCQSGDVHEGAHCDVQQKGVELAERRLQPAEQMPVFVE